MGKAREPRTSDPGSAGRRRRIICLAAAAGAVIVLAVLLALNVFSGQPSLPAKQAVLTSAAQGLDEYSIAAEFDPGASSLSARQTMRIQNRSGQQLSDVVLRTYANAFSDEAYSPAAIEDTYDLCYPRGFSKGSIDVGGVLLNGQAASFAYDDDARTVLRIPLPTGWKVGEWVELTLDYSILIPDCSFRFGHASGIYTLGNALPILSVWENGAWRTEEYFPLGDPFYSNCANYSVTVTVPAGYQCAGSAYGKRSDKDGKWTFVFDAPAVRDFALSISNQFVLAQAVVWDVLVTSYGLSRQAAGSALTYAKQALACYSALYGKYPYQHLAVAAIDFPFGGMEYPGLVLIQKTQYDEGREKNLELVAAHEAAHQWWYAVVGSDEYYNPWQDEALAEYSLLDYYQKYYGRQARDDLAFSRFETAMRASVPEGVTPGSPIDYFGSMSEYSLVVYRRGASLMVALEKSLGETFYEFLRTYYSQQSFRLASRQDFEQTLKSVSGQDWGALITDYLDTYLIN